MPQVKTAQDTAPETWAGLPTTAEPLPSLLVVVGFRSRSFVTTRKWLKTNSYLAVMAKAREHFGSFEDVKDVVQPHAHNKSHWKRETKLRVQFCKTPSNTEWYDVHTDGLEWGTIVDEVVRVALDLREDK